MEKYLIYPLVPAISQTAMTYVPVPIYPLNATAIAGYTYPVAFPLTYPVTVTSVAKPEESKKDKGRPVSSTPVPGTPWCVVWTGDSRSFFFNPSNKQSVWEKPAELVGRSDVAKMLESPTSAEEFKKKQQAKVRLVIW